MIGNDAQNFEYVEFVSKSSCIIYVVSLARYDIPNAMKNALNEFRKLFQHKKLRQIHYLLILNKMDEFSIKLRQTPMSVAFEDYNIQNIINPNDASQAARFIQEKFEQVSINFRDSRDHDSVIISAIQDELNEQQMLGGMTWHW